VRGDGDDRNLADAALARDLGKQRPAHGAGRLDVREDVPGEAEAGDQLLVPVPRVGVDELARRGDRVLGPDLAGQEVGKQVGHHQELVRDFELRVVLEPHREQLEERVELQKREPRQPEDLLLREDFKRLFHRAVGAPVPVVDGDAREAAALVDQAEVDAPGVDADRVDRDAQLRRAVQRDLHLVEQPRRVPRKAADQIHRVVRKAVQLGKLDLLAVEAAQHRPPARRAEVKSQKVVLPHHRSSPSPAARGKFLHRNSNISIPDIAAFSQDSSRKFRAPCMRFIARAVYTLHEPPVHPHYPHGFPQVCAAKPLSRKVFHSSACVPRPIVTCFQQSTVGFRRTTTKFGRFYDIVVRFPVIFLSISRVPHAYAQAAPPFSAARRLRLCRYVFRMYCKTMYSDYTYSACIKRPAREYRPASPRMGKTFVSRTFEWRAARSGRGPRPRRRAAGSTPPRRSSPRCRCRARPAAGTPRAPRPPRAGRAPA